LYFWAEASGPNGQYNAGKSAVFLGDNAPYGGASIPYLAKAKEEKVSPTRLCTLTGGDSTIKIGLRSPKLVLISKMILAHPPASENRR
jgi:hypothetical protein